MKMLLYVQTYNNKNWCKASELVAVLPIPRDVRTTQLQLDNTQ